LCASFLGVEEIERVRKNLRLVGCQGEFELEEEGRFIFRVSV